MGGSDSQMQESIRDCLNHIYEPIIDKLKELKTALADLQSDYKVKGGARVKRYKEK